MDPEIIRLNEVSHQRKTSHDINYIWNLKNDTYELIYKTEIDSLMDIEKSIWLPKGKEREEGQIGSLGVNIHTAIYKIYKSTKNYFIT